MHYIIITYITVTVFLFSSLKQLENEKARIQSALHEMDKPLARSKDDVDLVRFSHVSCNMQ